MPSALLLRPPTRPAEDARLPARRQPRRPGRRRVLAALAGLALAACGQDGGEDPGAAAALRGAGAAPLPDIVLVTIDTLRADHTGPHGYPGATTPFLDRLAGRGVLFERAYSTSSWTAPATASIFTGLYPNQHGVIAGFRASSKLGRGGSAEEPEADGRDGSAPRIHERMELIGLPGRPTLVEHLAAAGYETLGLATNINIGPELGFDRGFDAFERLHKADVEEVAARVLEWHEELAGDAPRFLYLHLNDVHKPYQGRPDFGFEGPEAFGDEDVEAARASYDSEIRYVDHWLGRLHDELGWERGTVVAVVSDHGEEFLDHGLTGHRYSLYGELNDVLMILAGPGLEGPRRVEVPVSLVDVLPTLLEVAGVEPPADLAGRSLLGVARGEPAGDERALFAHRIRGSTPAPLLERPPLWAVMLGRWKLIHDTNRDRIELFDLELDPGETEDLATERPDQVAALRGLLDRFVTGSVREQGTSVEVDVDDELLRTLEELGYAGD